MKLVERTDATLTLAEYAANIGSGPVIVTDHGAPMAALVPIANADLETVPLSTNPRLLEFIERSRMRVREEGGISSEDMRRRLQAEPERGAEC